MKFRTGIEAGTLLIHPGQVMMTENLGIWIIDLQTAEQVDHRVLLSWCARVIRFAVGIKASFVTDAYRMGIVATGVRSGHVLGTTLVYLSILGNVVVVADGFEATG